MVPTSLRPITSKRWLHWDPSVEPDTEIQFTPARVSDAGLHWCPMCCRSCNNARGNRGTWVEIHPKLNPLAPAELVIDHSVIADKFGTKDSFEQNTDIEYERNQERYRFLTLGTKCI